MTANDIRIPENVMMVGIYILQVTCDGHRRKNMDQVGGCGKNRGQINPWTLLCYKRNHFPISQFSQEQLFPTATISPTRAANYFPKKHFFLVATISQRAVNYFPRNTITINRETPV